MSNNMIVIKASKELTQALAPYAANMLQKEIGDIWWRQAVDSAFRNDPRIPVVHSQKERIDILDFGLCKRLLDSYWDRFFRLHLPKRFPANLSIAYDLYNKSKHVYNQTDMPVSETFQAISTMCLIMDDIKDKNACEEIQKLIKEIDIGETVVKPIKKVEERQFEDFSGKVIELVNTIKSGEIATYGDLSQMIAGTGNKNYSQTIATIIKNNAEYISSCHRIVGAGGLIKTSGKYNGTAFSQSQLLEQEGIKITVKSGKQYADTRKRKWKEVKI